MRDNYITAQIERKCMLANVTAYYRFKLEKQWHRYYTISNSCYGYRLFVLSGLLNESRNAIYRMCTFSFSVGGPESVAMETDCSLSYDHKAVRDAVKYVISLLDQV